MRKIVSSFVALSLVVVTCGDLAASAALSVPSATTVEPYVYIYGGVRKPSRYDWFDGMTVRDAIEAAGGVTYTNSVRVKIAITHIDGTKVLSNYERVADNTHKPTLLKKGDHLSVSGHIW